jgi:hypothetical protein
MLRTIISEAFYSNLLHFYTIDSSLRSTQWTGVVAHASRPSNWEAEEGE